MEDCPPRVLVVAVTVVVMAAGLDLVLLGLDFLGLIVCGGAVDVLDPDLVVTCAALLSLCVLSLCV